VEVLVEQWLDVSALGRSILDGRDLGFETKTKNDTAAPRQEELKQKCR
jgi:hypothetical protein